jgi:6-methylsalicylate decarboxylase
MKISRCDLLATIKAATMAFAGPGQILYGSDFLYAPAAVWASFTAKLDAYQRISKAKRDAINGWSVIALFDGLRRAKP